MLQFEEGRPGKGGNVGDNKVKGEFWEEKRRYLRKPVKKDVGGLFRARKTHRLGKTGKKYYKSNKFKGGSCLSMNKKEQLAETTARPAGSAFYVGNRGGKPGTFFCLGSKICLDQQLRVGGRAPMLLAGGRKFGGTQEDRTGCIFSGKPEKWKELSSIEGRKNGHNDQKYK